MQCQICKNQKCRKLRFFKVGEDKKDRMVSLYKCTNCGFVRPNPLPETDYVNKENYAKPVDFADPEIRFYQKNFYPYVRYVKDHRISGKHLDIGCRRGELMHLLKNEDLKSEGIEINKETAAVLRDKGFTVHDKPLGDKAYRGKKYDLITFCNVLEHIVEIDKFLGDVREMLEDNGYLILSIPYIYGLIPQVLRTRWYGQGYGEHHSFFSIRSIRKALADSGFAIKNIDITSMSYTTHTMPAVIRAGVDAVVKVLAVLNLGDYLYIVAQKK